jgi:hypothetical protein
LVDAYIVVTKTVNVKSMSKKNLRERKRITFSHFTDEFTSRDLIAIAHREGIDMGVWIGNAIKNSLLKMKVKTPMGR